MQPVSYRDEHSAPFGWRTRSQQNLHFDIYGEEAEGEAAPVPGLDRVTSRRWAPVLELQTNIREVSSCIIMEEAPTIG